jgi:hypothetical protein
MALSAISERRVDEYSRYQIFFFDPNDIKIELDFQASEAINNMKKNEV